MPGGKTRALAPIVLGAAILAGVGLFAAATATEATDNALETCDRWMREIETALAKEPPLRDEAYTAIMWGRLDAEAAYAAQNGPSCLAALDLPRRVLGLDRP